MLRFLLRASLSRLPHTHYEPKPVFFLGFALRARIFFRSFMEILPPGDFFRAGFSSKLGSSVALKTKERASRSILVTSGCHTRSRSTKRSWSVLFSVEWMKLVSMRMVFPFSQFFFSSPTLIQQSPVGVSRPRWAVRMKLVKSVCGLMPVPGVWRAKNASTEGTTALLSAVILRRISAVRGNRPQFTGSHSRSCRTSVFQSGPYARAPSSTADAQMLVPSASSFLAPSSERAWRSSSAMMSAFSSRRWHHLNSEVSHHGLAVRPSR
mmetsp:Transcript_20876/g.63638  ORF Transcript_20876/g.63638 Transcript_20876/m.63638 type:complete len:266 (-) Transcript_20876:393-1190(-)